MSQIKPSLAIISIAMALTIGGCGDKNPQANFNADSGQHLAGWDLAHKTAGTTDLESCFECHGDSLEGGISKVSCTQCHLGSAGAVHPLNWGQYAYARHKAFVNAEKSATDPSGTAKCTVCHGPALAGLGAAPACATACHLGGVSGKHPAVWTQYTSHANYMIGIGYAPATCSTVTCHGTDSKGVFLSGPSCFSCHPADPTDLAPVPDKHPHNMAATWNTTPKVAGGHGYYTINTLNGDISSCNTSICHGTGGPAPACNGCH